LEYCLNYIQGPKSDDVTQVKNTESGENLTIQTTQNLKNTLLKNEEDL